MQNDQDHIEAQADRIAFSPPQAKYPTTPEQHARIERAFTYHPPKDDQAERYVQIREAAKRLAALITTSTPPGREQSLALTHVEESAMWANAAIARGE